MKVLAIDPGPEQSAWVMYHDGDAITGFGIDRNRDFLEMIDDNRPWNNWYMAIEMIACYGMPVGHEVFDTCVWIGRFEQLWESMTDTFADRVYRRDVKLHLCNDVRAKDGNVRQALIDRYGGKETGVGKKASPGPLYGVSKDVWAALGVAVTYADTFKMNQTAHNMPSHDPQAA